LLKKGGFPPTKLKKLKKAPLVFWGENKKIIGETPKGFGKKVAQK